MKLIKTVSRGDLVTKFMFPEKLFKIMETLPDLCVVGGFLRDVCRDVVPEGDVDLLYPNVWDIIEDGNVLEMLRSKFGMTFKENDNAWNFGDVITGKTIQLLKQYGSVDINVANFDINVCQLKMSGQQEIWGHEIWGTNLARVGLIDNEAWFVNYKDRKWQRLIKHANLGFKITTTDLIDTVAQNFEEIQNSSLCQKTPWEIFDDLRAYVGNSGCE